MVDNVNNRVANVNNVTMENSVKYQRATQIYPIAKNNPDFGTKKKTLPTISEKKACEPPEDA